MDILYSDSNIVVCVKPHGMLSEYSESSPNVVSVLRELTGTDIYPIHRLDRETAGVMVYAKDSASAAALSRQIQENSIKKHYLAVINGEMPDSGILRDLLFRDSRKNKSYVVKRMRNGVREAELEYRVLSVNEDLSLADILLHTGRTHQIRVQFSSRKHPLKGDGKYGGGSGKLALFAYKLEFTHPKTGKKLEYCAMPDIQEYPWSLFTQTLTNLQE